MTSKRQRENVLAGVVIAITVGIGAVGVLFVVFAALFIYGVNQPRGGETEDAPVPLTFTVRLGGSDRTEERHELHLDAADVDALNLPRSVVVGEDGSMEIVSPLTDRDPQRTHCLIGTAEIVEQGTDAVVATVPAGTCIGKGDLVVPTSEAPAFHTSLEQVGSIGRGEPAALTGELVVRFDGCATIDGRRVIWPHGTGVDDTGSVSLADGSRLLNGSVVTVQTRPLDAGVPDWCGGGPALLVEGVG